MQSRRIIPIESGNTGLWVVAENKVPKQHEVHIIDQPSEFLKGPSAIHMTSGFSLKQTRETCYWHRCRRHQFTTDIPAVFDCVTQSVFDTNSGTRTHVRTRGIVS